MHLSQSSKDMAFAENQRQVAKMLSCEHTYIANDKCKHCGISNRAILALLRDVNQVSS